MPNMTKKVKGALIIIRADMKFMSSLWFSRELWVGGGCAWFYGKFTDYYRVEFQEKCMSNIYRVSEVSACLCWV